MFCTLTRAACTAPVNVFAEKMLQGLPTTVFKKIVIFHPTFASCIHGIFHDFSCGHTWHHQLTNASAKQTTVNANTTANADVNKSFQLLTLTKIR